MRYELSHDTIARQVYAKASAESQTRRKIEKYLADKRSMYEERGALLTQDDLEYIAPYLHAINIGDGERALVEESRTAIEKAERKRRRRLRWTIAVLAVSGFVALVAALLAWDNAEWADAQRLAALS